MRGIVIFLSLAAVFLNAQAPVGQIHGTVTDSGGLVIPSAPIVITEPSTGQRYEAASDEFGAYLVRALPPGEYTVTVHVEGFTQLVRQGIAVGALQNVRVDLKLEVGTTSQSIVVTGEVPQVDTRSGTLGTTIDDKKIVDLPLSGRNLVSFTNLAPGVTRISTANNVSYNQQRVNINGNRSYSTNMQLDGGSMYYAHRGQALLLPPPDAVGEVKVITAGVSAEYGRGTAVMSVITKSGSNEFHGSLWNFFRNDALDARRFFDISKAKLRYNQYGGTIGGPIVKNKLFFFGSYQGIKIRQDASSTSHFPPTAAERAGDFSASNPAPIDPLNGQPFANRQIPQSRFDPVAMKLIARIPLPTDPTGRLSAQMSQPINGDNVIGKFDYTMSEKNRLSFRYYFDYQRGINVFPNSSVPFYSPAPNSQDMRSLTLNYMRVWTPSLISTTRGSYLLFVYDESNSVRETLADLGAQNFVNGGGPPRLPFLRVTGRFEANPGRDQQRSGPGYDFAQEWSWVRNSHEFKWGASVQRPGFDRFNNSYSSGRFTFDGSITKNAVADLLLGRSVNFTQNSNSAQAGHYYIPAFYFQDQWRMNRRLTLTLGARWEVYTAWREATGQMAGYVGGVQSATFPTAPLGMVYQTDPQFPYRTDKVNIGPRIGFAWDLFGDGKTAIRGGYATSYDGIVGEVGLSGSQPYSLSNRVNNPGPLSNPYANTPNPYPYVVDPVKAKFELPASPGTYTPGGLQAMYNHNISFTLERQITTSWAVQSSYVGNLARKMLNAAEANPALYRVGATTSNTDSRRPLAPLYRDFWAYTTDANSSYHAWQTLVTKRMSHGLSLLAHYTLAKAIDDACTSEVLTDCRQQNPFDRRGSRGLGDEDRTHVAVISYVYGTPGLKNSHTAVRHVFGSWQLAGIHKFQTGNPLTVYTGSDVSLTAVGNDRPDLTGNPYLSKNRTRQELLNRWFDTSVFTRNLTGIYGNAGRGILRGPGDFSWDLSLQKAFPFSGEVRKLIFRTDMFNLLNHANLDDPQTTLSAPQSFGRISSTSGGRVVQLALRLEF